MKYTVESLRQFGIQVAEKAGMSHQDAEAGFALNLSAVPTFALNMAF